TTQREPARACSIAVLIEVPEVKGLRSNGLETTISSLQYCGRPPERRPRRRLRRQVRIAGCALLTLVGACFLSWSGHATRAPALPVLSPVARIGASDNVPVANEPELPDRQADASIGAPRAVVLSIEPTTVAPGAEAEVPVVFPGYVLPDDSF